MAALIDLCQICARGTMKLGSRYSWLVCNVCLEVNRAVGTVFGSEGGALPLGRHSMMNRITPGGGSIDDDAVADFVASAFGLISIWEKTFEWASREAALLFSRSNSAVGSALLPLTEWLDLFPTSIGASVDAFCRFCDYDLPDHPQLKALISERSAFLSL